MLDRIPDTLGEEARLAVSDSLWAASTIAAELPAGLIEDAQNAFISGFNGAAIFSAISVMTLAILAAVMLRHIEPLGPSDGGH